ncbi:MAG TPA: NAD-dependent epimerase/dehydratase family protein [Aggregatilineales bacterium]|nr:NAD-dependent epimerase/dehydratase family protein [Aggregatilineales bacterium]
MILITGGMGYIGSHIVKRLNAEGVAIRCLLPAGTPHQLPESEICEVVQGNLLDEELLFQAVTGVHTIIHLQSAQWWGSLRDLERIDLGLTRALIAAARAARVGRLIALSHLGSTPASAYPLLRIKGRQEELIRSSGLAYTIIRSALVFGPRDAFINHLAMMLKATPFVFLMPGQGEIVLQPIYIDDLVDLLVESLEQIDSIDTTIEVGGPEYITLEDLLNTVMRVTGTYRTIIPTPPYVLRWLTALYRRLFRRSLVTDQWLDLLATNRAAPLGNTITHFGVHPRRLEDTLLNYLPDEVNGMSTLRYALRRRPRGI